MILAKQIISDSAFGCAGQRCLAVSVAVTVGEAQDTFREAIADAADSIRVGNGLEAGVQMGPVITKESEHRIEDLIATGLKDGARAIVDGRRAKVAGSESGNFLAPTVLDGLPSPNACTCTMSPCLSAAITSSANRAGSKSNSPFFPAGNLLGASLSRTPIRMVTRIRISPSTRRTAPCRKPCLRVKRLPRAPDRASTSNKMGDHGFGVVSNMTAAIF
jgi:hypothetical protein